MGETNAADVASQADSRLIQWHEEVLLGSWRYGPKPSIYHISQTAGGQLRLEQNLSGNRTACGILRWDAKWFRAEIADEFGAVLGSIRLRMLASCGLVASNFRCVGVAEWGPDTLARKATTVSWDADEHENSCLVARQVEDSTSVEDLEEHPIQATQLDADFEDDLEWDEDAADLVARPLEEAPDQGWSHHNAKAMDNFRGLTSDTQLVAAVGETLIDVHDEVIDHDLERVLSQIMEEAEASQAARADAADNSAEATQKVAPWNSALLALPLVPGEKINAASAWDALWQQLTQQGWRTEYGPKGNDQQVYYLPPGVNRFAHKSRVDYFDSKLLVVRHLLGRGRVVIEVSGNDDGDDGCGQQDLSKRVRNAARPRRGGRGNSQGQQRGRGRMLPVKTAQAKKNAASRGPKRSSRRT